MKKQYVFLLFFLFVGTIFAQLREDFYDDYIEPIELKEDISSFAFTNYNSENGYRFPTKGTYRMLVVFINIIYDQTPSLNPNITNGWGWHVTNEEGINQLPPTQYFNDVFDVDVVKPHQGFFTRLMSECSFDSLLLLADFTTVEIKESTIRQTMGSGATRFASSIVKFINNQGGLQTTYGHNSIQDYDNISCGYSPAFVPNNKLDYVAFFVLNPNGSFIGISSGTGFAFSISPGNLRMSDGEFSIENWQLSGIGHRHIKYEPQLLVHEFAHCLLGPNSFHTSGGNHLGSSETATFLYSQFGYGLFNSTLYSCNAYERWRLGWQSPSNSPYKIAANGMQGEINGKFSGTRTFYLRDFVTYGDAIRIKLPYKDSENASNQYIWLENHQLGRNGKLDGVSYHFFPGLDCIPLGNPGIYAYYQVGKDILESSVRTEVYPPDEKDNLRMMNAEGNYNMEYVGVDQDCANWGERPTFKYLSENPISGANDQTEVINTTNDGLHFFADFYKGVGNKIKDGIIYNQFICGGDDFDGFNSGRVLDISSNPTPINAVTHYAKYYNTTYTKTDNHRDTRKKYLTGLSIKMNHAYYIGDASVFKVDIRWDDYDVKQDVHWAGDIVLKEQLNLQEGKTINLEQNLTPNQIDRDPVSGVFAPPTRFTCENGSNMSLAQNALVLLRGKSSFILESGATLQMTDGSRMVVEDGSTLIIRSGAQVSVNGSGQIIVKEGGYICVEEGADIRLEDYASVIFLNNGCFFGANPQLFDETNCSDHITTTGIGTVVDGSKDVYIQNETLSTNRFIGGCNIYVGKNVTTSKPQGNVSIKNGAHVIFEPSEEIIFAGGFECEPGSTFEVIKK